MTDRIGEKVIVYFYHPEKIMNRLNYFNQGNGKITEQNGSQFVVKLDEGAMRIVTQPFHKCEMYEGKMYSLGEK